MEEPADDVDEADLALAMSTELTGPASMLSARRTRSYDSLRDANLPIDQSVLRWGRRNYEPEAQLRGLAPKPIKICDRSLDNKDNDNPDGLWARNVTVTEPSIVRGNQSKSLQAVSGYVVWMCTVETFEGRFLKTYKRYSEFSTLRQSLCSAFPRYEKLIPPLPPKSVVSKFRPAFLEKRQRGLELFLSTVILMPELGASPIVKRVCPSKGKLTGSGGAHS